MVGAVEAARRCTAVSGERPGASSAMCSAVAVSPAAATLPSTDRSGSTTGTTGSAATVASTRRTTGCSTGSRTGTASTSGGATVSSRSSAAKSATAATGTATEATVPAGTALFTTGTAAIRRSAVPARLPTTGCRSPVGEGAASRMGVSAPVNGAATEDTVDVRPPRIEPESCDESAAAADADRASHVAVTAPARRNGRSARHGERALAMRTTPSTVETYDFTSLGLLRSARLRKWKINPVNLLICHSESKIIGTVSKLFTRKSQKSALVLQWASFG